MEPVLSYFNPGSAKHHALENFTSGKLSTLRKVVAVTTSVFLTMGVITSPFAIPVFRLISLSHTLLVSPPIPRREPPESLQDNLTAFFKRRRAGPLTHEEHQRIDTLIADLRMIEHGNKADQIRILKVNGEEVAAPFKVRSVVTIDINDQTHLVEMGRKYKVFVHAAHVQNIASGTFGLIRYVGRLFNENIAIYQKIAHFSTKAPPQDLVKEYEITHKLHSGANGHQVGIQKAPYKIFQSQGRWGYYVPSYLTDCAGFRLSKLVDKILLLSKQNKRDLFFQGAQNLLVGLAALHGLGYAHNDIKPENIGIQFNDYEWVLADFGLSGDDCDEIKGTRLYVTMEDVLQQEGSNMGKKDHISLVQKQDIYGMGCSLLEIYSTLTTRQDSFYSDWCHELWLYSYDGYYKKPNDYPEHPGQCPLVKALLDEIEGELGSPIRNILYLMISPNPNHRPTVREILENWNLLFPLDHL